MRYRAPLLVAFVLSAFAACTDVTVKPVDSSKNKIRKVCIKENPKVKIPEFTDILVEGFQRHGIKTGIYSSIPPECDYYLTYNADQKWDFVTFMSDAHLLLYNGDVLVGSADRDAPKGVFGGGGMEPSKWESTRTKLDAMVDELLKEFNP